ncbi:hypothetical protein CH063_12846 [Colletotrichum higginsianum]|uniref:Uncharacterized protein n=1 Tax=Colletotrichum higginsianum (strain IMI 349063) TaxID=759273 RepID=H1VS13_COLHI|nr:hypothetical protein CH063_12846 [Colletotrichum higginsianum]
MQRLDSAVLPPRNVVHKVPLPRLVRLQLQPRPQPPRRLLGPVQLLLLRQQHAALLGGREVGQRRTVLEAQARELGLEDGVALLGTGEEGLGVVGALLPRAPGGR